ncbi:MAG: hypothetical protein MI784_06510 [Cytophagales bacterium]|nr:hypothetical protein [Cytophagales bacterium]
MFTSQANIAVTERIRIKKKYRYGWIGEGLFILAACSFPLLLKFPYTINICLSFEGAYRLYLGQMPFRDFGLPMGMVYWYVPYVFFKIFGASMMSLLKAQFFINAVFLWTIRSIVKPYFPSAKDRLIVLLLFALTYTLQNFWPWYNSSTFVYQVVGVFFLLKWMDESNPLKQRIWVLVLALFNVLSFYTKQDTGALAILSSFAVIVAGCLFYKKLWRFLLLYIVAVCAAIVFYSYYYWEHGFSYWFNLGQFPHSPRMSVTGLLDHFFQKLVLEKLYAVAMIVIAVVRFGSWKHFLASRKELTMFLLCLYFVLQSVIIDYTSPISYQNHAYAHGFFWLYVFYSTRRYWVSYKKWGFALLLAVAASNPFWRYVKKLVPGGEVEHQQDRPEEKISRQWVLSSLPTMMNMRIPLDTQRGIERLKRSEVVKRGLDKVLNMTELTPLAAELGYIPDTQQPLWYHVGVSIFDKEIAELAKRIKVNRYDLVLYQHIPMLSDFYPSELRKVLKEEYRLIDTFQAPRPVNYGGESYIEVFVRKSGQ